MNNSKRPETVNPGTREPAARRRGRPPLPAEEAKRSPLTIRTTKAQKDELLRAGKAAGRSLAEEIDFRLGAARTQAAQGDFDELGASLDFVMELMAELRITVNEIERWVYSIALGVEKAGGRTKLVWDEVEEKFVQRPAALPPSVASRRSRHEILVRSDGEPKPPKPKRKSRRTAG